jgi:hypothetical protein
MRRNLSWLLPMLLVVGVAPALAQTQDTNFKVRCVADPDKVARALADAAAQKHEPEITGDKTCFAGQKEFRFNDQITLAVEHTDEMDFDQTGEPSPGDLVLFLDGKALHGTHPMLGPDATDADSVTTTLLTYRITHEVTTPAAQAAWKEILTGTKSRKVMTVSTGVEGGTAAASQATILFTAISTGRALLFASVAAVVIIIFLVIAGKTGALRDKEPAGDGIHAEKDRAYSLSRCQIALWTVIVLLSYLFIWFLTGEYNTAIPASVVTLMGLSLGTYGIAAAIDASKVTSKDTKVCPSDGVTTDLVVGEEGTSMHRLQLVVWTFALMVVFVVTVWRTLAMPDFDSTLLALMGISAGTYVGLKLPEVK